MRWLIDYGLATLVIVTLAACGSQSQTHKLVAQPPVDHPPAPLPTIPAVPKPAQVSVASASSGEQLDSLRAFLGVRPMNFRYVADSVRQGTVTVAGRFIVIHELFQTPRILYRSAIDSTRWLQFKLEPVGEAGTVGGDFTVDTVALDPQRQTLLLTLRGQNGFWGGSLDYSQTAIVDVTAEPLLLLKSETLREDVSYGRDHDAVYDEDAAGSESSEQTVRVRNHRLIIGPPRQTSRQGLTGKPVTSTIRPVPAAMLPAGQYYYRRGQLHRIR